LNVHISKRAAVAAGVLVFLSLGVGFVWGHWVDPSVPVNQTFAEHVRQYCYHVSPYAIPPPYSNYLNASGYDVYVCKAGTP